MTTSRRPGLLREVWGFARTRKRYWLAPILVLLTALAVLALFGETTVGIPVLYTLF